MAATIYFDLDGVLADMQGGLMKYPELVELRKILDDLINTKFTDYKGLVDDDIKTKYKAELEANPTSEVKELKKAFQKYTSKVFSIASKPKFYFDLPLMEGAKNMVEEANKLNGKLSNVLSSPVGDDKDADNISIKEKEEWVKTHFPGMFDKVIIKSDKENYAKSKSDILIDDRPKYVEKFTSAGGTAILHTDCEKSISELKSILNSIPKQNESRTFIMTYESFRNSI